MTRQEPKCNDLRISRDEALYFEYLKAVKEHHFTSDTEAVNWVRTHPAPRFFVSPEFCSMIVSRMLHGQDCGMKGLRRERAREMLRIYKEICDTPKMKGKAMIEICNAVVDMPAPRWYLGRRAVSQIIAEQKVIQRKKIYERWK